MDSEIGLGERASAALKMPWASGFARIGSTTHGQSDTRLRPIHRRGGKEVTGLR
jgi:hypothetical protein